MSPLVLPRTWNEIFDVTIFNVNKRKVWDKRKKKKNIQLTLSINCAIVRFSIVREVCDSYAHWGINMSGGMGVNMSGGMNCKCWNFRSHLVKILIEKKASTASSLHGLNLFFSLVKSIWINVRGNLS